MRTTWSLSSSIASFPNLSFAIRFVLILSSSLRQRPLTPVLNTASSVHFVEFQATSALVVEYARKLLRVNSHPLHGPLSVQISIPKFCHSVSDTNFSLPLGIFPMFVQIMCKMTQSLLELFQNTVEIFMVSPVLHLKEWMSVGRT